MPPVFEAFEPSVVVDEFARKIEALCVWKQVIIASLSDGSLLFFEEQQQGVTADHQDDSPVVSTWQVTRAQKGFTKRGAHQLQALESQPLLLSLSDDGVHLHSLPECIQVSAASRTAKSAAFAWDEGRQLLATAGRKKVLTHWLDRSAHSLQEMTEYTLPDSVLAVQWVGSNMVAATAKSYWLIVPAPPQSVEVLPGQLMTIYPTVAPQQLFAAGGGAGGGGQAGGAAVTPLMARVGAEEVLVTKDGVSYFLGPDGKPCRKTGIHWSQPPRCLVATPMYAVALLPSAVEVKGISRAAAATAEQMLLLPNMAAAAPRPAQNGCIYIASGGDGGIRQLRPLPLERQAKLLAAAGDFQGALELLTVLEEQETAAHQQQQQQQQSDGGSSHNRLPGEAPQQQQQHQEQDEASIAAANAAAAAAAERRQQLEDVLRLRFGYHLFEAGEYDEALTQLSMCSDPDPLLLLKLYPQLVPDKFKELLPTTAYGEPLPADPQQKQQKQQQKQQPDSAASTSSSSSGKDGEKGQQQQQKEQKEQQQKQQQQVDAAAAVSVVVPYLLSHRTRLLGSLEGAAEAAAAAAAAAATACSSSNGSRRPHRQRHKQQQQQRDADDDPSGSDSGSSNSSHPGNDTSGSSINNNVPAKPQKSVQELRLLATVIDTAILRAMLLQPDSGALLRLVQQSNYVDLEDGEAVLTAVGRYAELAALYQYHKRHEKGLRLLQQLSQNPEGLTVAPTGAAADLKGLPGVWAAVRYLIAVHPQDLSLLQAHAGWILQADPEAGLEALLAMNPPLAYNLVLPLLEAHAHAYTAVYLESALELGQVSPQEVHSELLLIYLHMALEEERDGEASSEAHARQLSLSDLLVSRPHTPLKLFPDDHTLWAAPGQQRRGAAAAVAAAAAASAAATGSSSSSNAPVPKGGTLALLTAAAAARAAKADSAAAAATGDNGKASAAAGEAGGAVVVVPPKYDAAALAAPHHPHHRRDAYQRLRELVYASPYIDPDYVLSKLQQGQLLEIRALMLERLGRHREALSVYVHELHSMKLAEEYCDRVYEAGLAAAAAAGPTGANAAAAAAAAAAAVATPTEISPRGGAGSVGAGGGSGGVLRRPGELSPGGGGDAGPKWDKVQLVRQRVQQQGSRRGFGVGADAAKPSWSALPFGGSPQDIYMELVDAVLQGPRPPSSSGGSTPVTSPAAKGSSSSGRAAKQKQKQQQQQQGGAPRSPSPGAAAAAPAASADGGDDVGGVDVASWKALSDLLARKNDRINHLQVLGELTADLPLSEVSPLLCSMLLYNTEQSRNSDVVLHLRRAENLMAREDLVKVKQRVVALTFDRACCICHKRMGGAVSVAYPNGSLAHYLCYKRSAQKGGGTGSEQQQQLQGNGAWGGGGLLQGVLPGVQQQQQGGEWGAILAAAAQ